MNTQTELQAIVDKQAQANRKLTNDQFKGLERNTEGDIIYLSDCFFLISDKQRDQLSTDDWSRIDMLEEDMRCMDYYLELHVEPAETEEG